MEIFCLFNRFTGIFGFKCTILLCSLNFPHMFCVFFSPLLSLCLKQYFLKSIFNWRKIALKCCVGFCRPIMQISHNYISPLHREPPSPLLSYLSRSSESTRLAQHGALGSNGCVSTRRYLAQDQGCSGTMSAEKILRQQQTNVTGPKLAFSSTSWRPSKHKQTGQNF